VQFYNNPQCQIGGKDFDASINQWSHALLNSTISPSPRLFLGALAWQAPGSKGYVGTPEGIEAVASSVKQMGLQNFGGIMFWDGPEGKLNVGSGKSIIDYAKAGIMA
jgi:chitinase